MVNSKRDTVSHEVFARYAPVVVNTAKDPSSEMSRSRMKLSNDDEQVDVKKVVFHGLNVAGVVVRSKSATWWRG